MPELFKSAAKVHYRLVDADLEPRRSRGRGGLNQATQGDAWPLGAEHRLRGRGNPIRRAGLFQNCRSIDIWTP